LFSLEKRAIRKLFAKAGSDSASKFEFLAFVEANKQRAKIFSGTFRLGVSADDEFLLLIQLKLDPCSAAFAGLIPGANALAY
jgi:hypothetical protein